MERLNTGRRRRGLALLAMQVAVTSCATRESARGAQCADAEHGMFLACVEQGCSAQYSQSLAGSDECDVSGGGSVVSVEAGGGCAFSSEGTCFVVCECPEDKSVEVDVSLNLQEHVVVFGRELTARVEALEAAQAEDHAALVSQIDELADEVDAAVDEAADVSAAVDEVEADVAAVGSDVAALWEAVDRLEATISGMDGGSGLVVSRYTVDCSLVTLESANPEYSGPGGTGTGKSCVVVDDVAPGEHPLVQVIQDRDMLITEFVSGTGGSSLVSAIKEFEIGQYDGGYDYGGGTYRKVVGPGVQLRYDSVTEQIYTAPHIEFYSGTYLYHVVVVGSKEYFSPY